MNDSKKIVRASRSNFASSFWFLPREKREALNTIYAYCRLSDDLVDLASSPDEAKSQLAEWRKTVSRAFKEKSEHPVLHALALTASRYQIPEIYFHQLLDGVQMDLERNRYATFDELYPYCYQVASVVGLMCLEVFGYQNAESKEFAVNLGIAFQLTNILRDIKSDIERGRVYIPEEDLKKFNLSREDLLALNQPSELKLEKMNQFKALIDFECGRAGYYYKKAREHMTKPDRSNFAAAEVMCAVYHRILLKIKAKPLAPLSSKVRLGRFETLFCILQGWIGNKLSLVAKS